MTAGFKIDLHKLMLQKLDWDYEIPKDIREIWVSNFNKFRILSRIVGIEGLSFLMMQLTPIRTSLEQDSQARL